MPSPNPQLRQGSVVAVQIRPSRGDPKVRPVVVISASDDIAPDRPVVGVAVTTTFPHPAPEGMIELPWFPRGHPATGLARRSAAVCNWLVEFTPEDVLSVRGGVPESILLKILANVRRLEDEKAPDAPQ